MPDGKHYRQNGPKWKEINDMSIKDLNDMLDSIDGKSNEGERELKEHILNVLSEENMESYSFLTNVPEDNIRNMLDSQKIQNSRYDRSQFTKYFGIKDVNWVCLMTEEECLAIAALSDNNPFNGYAFIQEIQTLKKGYGRYLLKEIFDRYGKVSLMANTTAGEDLLNYYRKFDLEEIVIPDSIYGCPAHFFCTKDCDYDKLEAYFIAFFSNDDREQDLDENAPPERLPYGNIRLGMIVKNLKGRYLDRLLDGTKTIETRYEKTWNMMKRSLEGDDGADVVGQNIALMQDSHTVNAIAKITEIVRYGTEDEFRRGYEDHLVDAGDENVGWNGKRGPKYGIRMEIVRRFDPPKDVRRITMKGNPMANKVMHGFVDDSDRISVLEEADQDIGGEKSDISNQVNGKKIWIDDLREAPEGFVWFKTVREFIRYVDEHGTSGIALIDTDHDAGDYQKFGGDYIRCFDYLDYIGAKNITIHIHSANPVGANNIRRIISKNKEENNWREVRNT